MKAFRVTVNGTQYQVEVEELEPGQATPLPAKAPSPPASPASAKTGSRPQPSSALPRPSAPPAASSAGGGTITAPIPGTVLRIDVAKGASVTKGQTLLVLEAMKMENDILAPQDGRVEELQVAQGASVNTGDVLIVLS